MWWIPLVILWYAVYSLASKYNQDEGGHWFIIVLLLGFCPIWAFVSRYSKNLTTDAIIYDVIIITSLPITLSLFGYLKWSLSQWVGLLLVSVGIFVIVRS